MKSVINRQVISYFAMRMVAMLVVILFFCSAVIRAQSPSEFFNRANESYKANQFRAAADDYEKLLSQQYQYAEVYFNLGNCYYKMDSVGKSILNYERGLRLAPEDEDIKYNLRLAKLKSVDAIQPVPQPAFFTWWSGFVNSNSAERWGVYALISIWLSLFIVAVYLFFVKSKLIRTFTAWLLCCSFACLALALHQRQQHAKSVSAVVMVRSAFVKSAPDAGAGNLFMIHEGTAIQLLDHVGDWNKIRLEDGKIGWLGNENFEKI